MISYIELVLYIYYHYKSSSIYLWETIYMYTWYYKYTCYEKHIY